MEVKKAIRKVIALGTGASMIGATLLGAMAADLASYPSPFVKDGKFDAFIVVGQDAQPEDVVGAVDIGASLQFEMRKATTISTGAANEAAISEGVRIQKTGNKLNYNEEIADIQSKLTEDDLPEILADGVYRETKGDNDNDETYTQELVIESGNAKLIFDQHDTNMPKAGAYLEISKKQLYNYTLEFDDSIEYNTASKEDVKKDLESTTIKIQGQVYTITDVDVTSGNKLNKLTMLAGETVLWLQQDQPITKTVNGVDHTVTVVDVTEDEKACLIKVDDTQLLMEVGDTETISGVEIGVTDARAIHAQLQDTDICQVNVGATKLVLEDGKDVINNGDEVDGAKVTFMDSGAGSWDGFMISYKVDNKAYLGSGDAWTDPVFDNWKIAFGGMSEVFEEIKATASGNDGELVFESIDNKMVSIPVFRNDSNTAIFFGSDEDEMLLINGTALDTCRQADIEDCEGTLIWAVTTGGEPHVLQIASIDDDGADSKISIDDLTYGKSYKDKSLNVDGTVTTLTLNFGTIELKANSTLGEIQVVAAATQPAKTKKESQITLVNSTVSPQVVVAENPDVDEVSTLATITLTFANETDEDEMKVTQDITPTTALVASKKDKEDGSDIKVSVTMRGTQVWEDTDAKDEVTIKTSDSDSYGNVFIAPIAATVSEASGGLVTYEINKINVGASRLDTEITSVSSDNLISVGGPCVNRVSAQVMGKSYPSCGADSGIPENAAMIKLFTQSTGKVSLVVAGWNAADTRRATRVLSDATLRKGMSGSAVKVTGTSWTDIAVSPMQ